MVFRLAYLHIGLPKTGSTSLQAFLAANRPALKKQGFRYAVSLGQPENWRLSLYMQPWQARDLGQSLPTRHERMGISSPAAWDDFCIDVEERLERELAGLDAGIETLLLSDSSVCSVRVGRNGVERLKAFLDRYFEEIRVVVYLRRQDDFLISCYTTALETGFGSTMAEWIAHEHDLLINYANVLDLWAEIFGADKLSPRLYRRDRWPNGDLFADFAQAIGLDSIEGFQRPENKNVSLDPLAQELMRQLNRRYSLIGPIDDHQGRASFFRYLQSHRQGPGQSPSWRARRALMARYAESNEAMQRRWFPDEPDLFRMEKTAPEGTKLAPRQLSSHMLLEILAGVIGHFSQDLKLKDADCAELEGKLYDNQGKSEEAVRAYGRALTLDPSREKIRLRRLRVLLNARREKEAAAELTILRSQQERLSEAQVREIGKWEAVLKRRAEMSAARNA